MSEGRASFGCKYSPQPQFAYTIPGKQDVDLVVWMGLKAVLPPSPWEAGSPAF